MSLPPTTNSSIFNSSYFPAGTLTLAAADQRYLLLTGGIIGGPLSISGTTASVGALTVSGGSAPSSGTAIGMRYDVSGDVGILNAFDYSSAAQKGINICNGSIFIKSDKTVGIGTVSPGYSIDVSGSANVSSSYRVGGTVIVDSSRNATFGSVSLNNIVSTNANLDDTDLQRIDGIIAGTVAASKCIVVSSSKDFGIARRISAQNINLLGGGSTDDYTNLTRLLNCIDSSIATGTSRYITLGRSFSSKNSGEVAFYFAADASDDNRLSLGQYGASDTLNVFGSGTVSIGSTSRSNARLYLSAGVGNSTIAGSSQVEILSNTSLSQQLAPFSISNPSIRAAGSIITEQALYVSSDRRLKQDIEAIPLEDARRFVHTCLPRRFVLRANPNRQEFGYIAQSLLHAQLPQLIDAQPDEAMHPDGDKYDLDGYRLNVSYDRVAPLLHTYLLDMDRRISDSSQPADRRRVSFVRDQDFSDEQVLGLKLRHWRRNTDGRSDFGLLAQECRTQLPELVSMKADPDMKKVQPDDIIGQLLSVSHDKLGVILLPVVQRLLKRVHALETEFGLTGVVYTD